MNKNFIENLDALTINYVTLSSFINNGQLSDSNPIIKYYNEKVKKNFCFLKILELM